MIPSSLLLVLAQIDFHPFRRVTEGATGIQHLFLWFLIAATVVFLAVIGFMVYSMIKYRYRGEEDEREVPQIHANTKLETILTGISLALVFLFGVLSLRLMMNTLNEPPPGRTANSKPDIVIIGHQWWWEARYPKAGFTTANEVHFPVGKKVLVKFKSADVVHDWWLLALGQKMDMFPGHFTHLWIKIKKPGKYWGTCAEYCGTQHAHMQIHVIAQPIKEYRKWKHHQAQPALPPSNRKEILGAALFGSKACGSCHTIRGNPSATGDVGPSLTHFGSRNTILTFLQNTPENLHAWLDHPSEVKKGAHMPSFRFTDKQLDNLVTYLESLK